MNIKRLFKSKLLGNTFVYGLTNALYTGLPLLLLPFLVSTLDPEDYGDVELFRSLTLVSIPLLGLSAVQAIGRFYYDLNDQQFRTFVSSIQIFQLFTTIAGIGIVFSFSFLLSQKDVTLLYLSCIYFLFNQLTESLLTIYRVKEMPFRYLYIRVGSVLLELFLMFLLYYTFSVHDWTLRVFPMVIGSVVVGVITFILFRVEKYRFVFSWSMLVQGLSYSTPLILHMLSGYLLNIGDRFLIKVFLTPEDLGNYAVAYQAGMAVNFFYTSFNLAWTPTFFKWMKEGRTLAIAKVRKIVYYSIVGLGLIVAILWYVVFPIIDVGDKYNVSSSVVLVVLISYMILSLYKFETNYFLYNKETKRLSVYTMVSAGVSLILNFILIPIIGIFGAAIATLVSFVCIYLLVLLNKKNDKIS